MVVEDAESRREKNLFTQQQPHLYDDKWQMKLNLTKRAKIN